MSQKDLSVVQNGENNIFISNEKNVNINVSSGTTIYGYAVLGSDVATNKVSS